MKRNKFIDILKGICIIFVIVEHAGVLNLEARQQLLFPYSVYMTVPILMILSGYVSSLSFKRHSVDTLKDAYHYKLIIEKFVRFTIPFLIAYLLEFAISAYDNGVLPIINVWIRDLSVGGWGPGSYYYPFMIQFIFLFPILYFIIKKYDFAGLILCGILNAVYEWLQYTWDFSSSTYRLLLFRYILTIAYGCYICIGKTTPKKWVSVISSFIGAYYIWLYWYQGYEPTVLSKWTQSCFISSLFIMPIIRFLLNSERVSNLSCKPLELLGKASYHVFLVQMVYHNYVTRYLYVYIDSAFGRIALNLSICLLCGVIFYLVEGKITKKLLTHIHAFSIDNVLQKIISFINKAFVTTK